MRLSDLRPCDGCGGPLFQGTSRCFHVVETSVALVTLAGVELAEAAARRGVPIAQLEEGESRAAVVVLAEQAQDLRQTLVLCTDCHHARPVAEAARRRQERRAQDVASGGGRPS